MKGKNPEKEFRQRLQEGKIGKEDVTRRLAELAYGRCNDCVRLVMEDAPELKSLDLSLLSEVRRSEKGMVEVRMVDRLRVLEQLAQLVEDSRDGLEDFLLAMQGSDRE